MAQFVVLEPEETQNLEQAVFVRDGFHVWALVLPFVWLLAQRLWFEAFAVVGVTILLGLVATHFGIEGAVPVLTLLMSLFVALEGANWKIARLRRRGFVEKAVIDASDLEEAEIRYFCRLEDAGQPVAPLADFADKPAPRPALHWTQQPPRPAYSSFGSTIGFVGHRGEN
ncbi:DUF2628 domain-containing protein [Brucella intermedia]|uniref:DUF2628 domain-containing protein n=1 Tax=Brucella intermedia TaxID=94625 RepID=UPI0021C7679F|nr:DUF2628 domain-containing protein [Brucella intermedia]UXO82932.1 DUF2628 domain-containing protein [Brucella intermedia]